MRDLRDLMDFAKADAGAGVEFKILLSAPPV
jgi:hypothetical protein